MNLHHHHHLSINREGQFHPFSPTALWDLVNSRPVHFPHVVFPPLPLSSNRGRPICNLRFADNIDVLGGCNGELQDLTNRLVDRVTAYGSQHRKQQDHDQQHEQHQCRYKHERPEVRGSDQFNVPESNPPQGWHLLSRSPHQDCLSNDSNDRTKQDLAVHQHQLRKQVQALQVSGNLHRPIWL